jgi:MATE family multidrug resistance protein
VAVNISTLFLIFFMGLLMACSPIVAQMVGAGRAPAEIGAFFRRSRRFALVAGVVWVLLLNLCGPSLIRMLALPEDTTLLAISFLRWFSGGGLATALWFGLRFAAEGHGQVRPILLGGIAGLLMNALLGWMFAFGHLGPPALGINGLGLASTLATSMTVVVLLWQYRHTPILREALDASRVATAVASREGARDILRLGLPIAAMTSAEGGLFVLTALLMARFGEHTVAAYQIAINFASLLFMIPLGIGMATTVRVGFAAGAGDHAEARFRGWIGIALGGLNAASNATIMALFSGAIIAGYTADPQIAVLAVSFLWLAAAFQLFDGLQTTANGALRGLKDTRTPMAITLCSYWAIGLPTAAWLAFRTPLGPAGLWWGLTAGLGAASVGLGLRFRLRATSA